MSHRKMMTSMMTVGVRQDLRRKGAQIPAVWRITMKSRCRTVVRRIASLAHSMPSMKHIGGAKP